jgi:hypothetical protein
MRIPNAQQAVIDRRKLVDYCLSLSHPVGKHKARLFLAALGMTSGDADQLERLLHEHVTTLPAIQKIHNGLGVPFELRAEVRFKSRTCTLLSIWIIRDGEDFPRLGTV